MPACLQPAPEDGTKPEYFHYSAQAQFAKDPAIFIVPVLQFFGLPDYNFEPLRTDDVKWV